MHWQLSLAPGGVFRHNDCVKAKAINYPHIGRNAQIASGAPIVKGTRITVRTIAGYYQLGLSPDEILQSLPHLTQSQLHAALAYYFDHQKEIDRELERDADIEHWRAQVRHAEMTPA